MGILDNFREDGCSYPDEPRQKEETPDPTGRVMKCLGEEMIKLDKDKKQLEAMTIQERRSRDEFARESSDHKYEIIKMMDVIKNSYSVSSFLRSFNDVSKSISKKHNLGSGYKFTLYEDYRKQVEESVARDKDRDDLNKKIKALRKQVRELKKPRRKHKR